MQISLREDSGQHGKGRGAQSDGHKKRNRPIVKRQRDAESKDKWKCDANEADGEGGFAATTNQSGIELQSHKENEEHQTDLVGGRSKSTLDRKSTRLNSSH